MLSIRRIRPDVFKAPVVGLNLEPGGLADQLDDSRTLLVFLRHLGCPFTRQSVLELRELTAEDPAFPPVLFFHQSSVKRGNRFFERYWPAAFDPFWPRVRAIADPKREFFRAFQVPLGTPAELFGPRVWGTKIGAWSRGHYNGLPARGLLRMPGLCLVEGDLVLWRHRFRHAGDFPDFADMPLVAAALA